jgi:16S rRNA (cytidine1402-2'-O)-methyltransferase
MGTLYLVSTPIGNLDDFSKRACFILSTVSIILCEDTRRTGIFLTELKNRGLLSKDRKHTLISYYNQIEQQRIPQIIDNLTNDISIALISDCGTPLISDPGYRIVTEARKRNIPVIAIPGASAVLTALVSSGLPANQFTFLGFVPEKSGKQMLLFSAIQSIHEMSDKNLSPTYIFYCAPHKLKTAFSSLLKIFGDIPIIVARELTKIHEEIWSGSVNDAIKYFETPKGEFVVLFHLDTQSHLTD